MFEDIRQFALLLLFFPIVCINYRNLVLKYSSACYDFLNNICRIQENIYTKITK